jgi:hypothetical protein
LYFGRNRGFFIPISAKFDEHLEQNFSKKPEPAKAGLHTGNSRPESKKNLDSKKCELAKAGPS